MTLARSLVDQMYADYCLPMSLAAVARKYDRNQQSLREVFVKRGLAIRPATNMSGNRLPNGQMAPAVPMTAKQIQGVIAKAKKVSIPAALHHEFRKWPLERRAWFLRRLRAKLKLKTDRPETPFSSNVEAFDYGSERAHAIQDHVNGQSSSRVAPQKMKTSSQGVIWNGELWFWTVKEGYRSGYYYHGRPRKQLHHAIWESFHGRSMPPRHCLRFADGNWNNLGPKNLVLMTKNDVARENQAAHLVKKSREVTELLLKRSQSGGKTNGQSTFNQLRQRGKTQYRRYPPNGRTRQGRRADHRSVCAA